MSKKIIHINFTDKTGGAAIAAYRHNEALNQIGYDSKMLVINKSTNNSKIVYPEGKAFFFKIKTLLFSSIANKIIRKYKPYATFSSSPLGFKLKNNKIIKEADIIVLHWICNNMLSIKGIEEILKLGKPVIWFLHDMWPMTGGCHYTLGCDYYKNECHNCPLLFNRRGSAKYKDISYQQLKSKIKRWRNHDNLYIVSPSKWLAQCAEKSTIFKNHKISVLRNVINTTVYKPVNKDIARTVLGLPLKKKLVLFGADSVNSPYKGWNYLKDALDNLDSSEVECVVFGNSDITSLSLTSKIKINYLGRFNDDLSLSLLYNACDVFVTPSIADNYPNVILEAMSCGLPCVGFNIGGIPEMIQHKMTGYISNDISTDGLLIGINWILNSENITYLSNNSRQWVIENSSYQSLKKHLSLNNLSKWIK